MSYYLFKLHPISFCSTRVGPCFQVLGCWLLGSAASSFGTVAAFGFVIAKFVLTYFNFIAFDFIITYFLMYLPGFINSIICFKQWSRFRHEPKPGSTLGSLPAVAESRG